MANPTYRYTVRGRGDFPTDMLRYDECVFASFADRASAEGTMTPATHTPGRRDVSIIGTKRPTEARWASFGWTILEGERSRLDPDVSMATRVPSRNVAREVIKRAAAAPERSDADRAATQRHTVFNALVGACGKTLTPDLVQSLTDEIVAEMQSGATAWAFATR